MSSYSLTVTNNSGADQNIAIYQDYPSLLAGMPLVWLAQTVNNGNNTTYTWDINWGINWGTTSQPLSAGVQWTSGGPFQAMDPLTAGGNNSMGLTYTNKQFKTTPTAYHQANVKPGCMAVSTDTSFTVAQSAPMSLAVYMNGTPAFVVPGQPNGTYLFETHPVYWICVTDYEAGTAISSEYLSNAVQLSFPVGVTSLNYQLNNVLNFVPA